MVELTPQEKELREGRLQQKEHTGAIMRDFCRHPGFKILESLLKKEIEKVQKNILDAKTPQECWELKVQAEPYQKVFDLIFKTIAHGDAANLALRLERDSTDSGTPQGR